VAKRQQVGRRIVPSPGTATNVMDLEIPAAAAELAGPAVPVKDLDVKLRPRPVPWPPVGIPMPAHKWSLPFHRHADTGQVLSGHEFDRVRLAVRAGGEIDRLDRLADH